MSLYIVDGNNLKGYLTGAGQLRSTDDASLILWLRRIMSDRRGKRKKAHRTLVFFDAGSGDRRTSGDSSLVVRVAPPGVTADEAILREIARLPAASGRRDAILITSDRALQEQAIALGVSVLDCERFAGQRASPRGSETGMGDKERVARELGHSLDDAFLPVRERRSVAIGRPAPLHLPPRKITLLRDPARLTALLQQGDRVVRRRAALALAKAGAAQSRPLLEQVLLTDPVPSVRASAAAALGQIGDPRSLEALRRASTDAYSLVRAAVASALAGFEDSRTESMLSTLRGDSRRRVRQAALASSRRTH